jgi:hypothetical protein
VTTGKAVLTGGAAATVAVGALARLLVPSGLVAVTYTRRVAPTSAVASAYDGPVAPAMSTQVVPLLERCHW